LAKCWGIVGELLAKYLPTTTSESFARHLQIICELLARHWAIIGEPLAKYLPIIGESFA